MAGILLSCEVVLRVVPEERLIPAKSRQGEIFFMEREVLPCFPEPRVLLLGSSRARRAVVPRQLDEELALPANSTLNVGLASGRVFEALYLYQRNRAQFARAQLVVLNVDEWYLSAGWRLGSLYEMHAPWSERVQFPEPLRNRLLLDGAFGMRLRLKLAPGALANALGLRRKEELDLTLDENNQVLPPARKPLPVDVAPAKFDETINTFYHRFQISPVMEGHVAELARLVREDGGAFVLMQLPNRAAYRTRVEKLRGTEYAQHLAALRALATRLNAPLYIYDQPQECGLTDASFEDYGHVNAEGARVFTRSLAELIRREGWLTARPAAAARTESR